MLRKAQAQIITTVLIILLVLAAIVIVWQVVRQTVGEGAGEIESATDCATLSLEIVEPVAAGTSITVKRNVGTGDLKKIKFIINNADSGEQAVTNMVDELG